MMTYHDMAPCATMNLEKFQEGFEFSMHLAGATSLSLEGLWHYIQLLPSTSHREARG